MRRVAAVVVALVSALALAGCSSNGPEATQPPPLSSLLARPSHAPVVPPPSPAVIKSAVQAFIDGLNDALRTGDTRAAERASTSSCNCRDELSQIRDVYSRHFTFVNTKLVVLRIVPTTLTPGESQARVTARVPQSAIANAKGKKKVLKARPARPILFTLVDDAGRWVVSSISGPTGTTPTTKASPTR